MSELEKKAKRIFGIARNRKPYETWVRFDTVLKVLENIEVEKEQALAEQKQKLQDEFQKLIDILALPNMGDEGRKRKLLAIMEWRFEFQNRFLEEKP